MRVPSNTLFDQQTYMLTQSYEKAANYNVQVTTGKKLLRSSDDPVLSSRIKQTQSYIETLQSYSNNTVLAKSRSDLFVSTARSMQNIVARVQELISQANNDQISNGDRNLLAKELDGYMNTMLSIGNTRDGNGEFIYGGYNTTTEPFTKSGNTYVYQGGNQSAMVDISPNTQVLYTESGYSVFGDINTGNGTFTIQNNPANTGTASTSAGSITTGAYVKDTYTLRFVTNGSGELAYQVIGATSGQVVPTPPATAPTDAPAYKNNDDISFNGVTFRVTGTPNVGDEFTVAPSQKQNLFNTMSQLINVLKTPINNEAERANFRQQISQLTVGFNEINNKMISYEAEAGTRSNVIENESDANTNLIREQNIVLSGFSDVNMAEAISKFSQQTLALQVTQQGYLKIQEVMMQMLQM